MEKSQGVWSWYSDVLRSEEVIASWENAWHVIETKLEAFHAKLKDWKSNILHIEFNIFSLKFNLILLPYKYATPSDIKGAGSCSNKARVLSQKYQANLHYWVSISSHIQLIPSIASCSWDLQEFVSIILEACNTLELSS